MLVANTTTVQQFAESLDAVVDYLSANSTSDPIIAAILRHAKIHPDALSNAARARASRNSIRETLQRDAADFPAADANLEALRGQHETLTQRIEQEWKNRRSTERANDVVQAQLTQQLRDDPSPANEQALRDEIIRAKDDLDKIDTAIRDLEGKKALINSRDIAAAQVRFNKAERAHKTLLDESQMPLPIVAQLNEVTADEANTRKRLREVIQTCDAVEALEGILRKRPAKPSYLASSSDDVCPDRLLASVGKMLGCSFDVKRIFDYSSVRPFGDNVIRAELSALRDALREVRGAAALLVPERVKLQSIVDQYDADRRAIREAFRTEQINAGVMTQLGLPPFLQATQQVTAPTTQTQQVTAPTP